MKMSIPLPLVFSRQQTKFVVLSFSFLDIRLVGGRNKYEGRVEIYIRGRWGTICDDYWGRGRRHRIFHRRLPNANVACRALGLGRAEKVFRKASKFGRGKGKPIWLDDVYCRGSERALMDCHHRPIGRHNCSKRHGEDVGIRCR